ncbi:hypothetical protein [Enterovirga rhinocerotis]|uniref:Uncharacterized protein n=1 Tax=Enterovirga rhinocerotis TaxID=1339210 RepID=A0A4R7C155_9HYPH|nr:hypothetical protein [Enterovirga rhinocerotis]TDR90227.1 hypothetical protein EV668_3069 [Enterovirga rhinocerotis]
MSRVASPPVPTAVPAVTEEDVDAVLAEFGGDARAAVRGLLNDLDTLARDHAASVSHGFVRGDLPRLLLPSRRAQIAEAGGTGSGR